MEITRLRVDKSGAKYKISSHSFGARFELTSERANAAGWPTSIHNKRSSEDRRRNWIGPIKTHCYKKSGTNSIFSTSNERIFSGKEKRNTCRIRSYITRILLNVRLNFIEEGKFQLICNPLLQRYYWNVNSLETLSTRTIGTSYLQPLGSTLKLLACYSFVAIMQLFGHSRQFS